MLNDQTYFNQTVTTEKLIELKANWNMLGKLIITMSRFILCHNIFSFVLVRLRLDTGAGKVNRISCEV